MNNPAPSISPGLQMGPNDPRLRKKNRSKYIRFSNLLQMALKNLFFKKLRTTLTVMGVVIGIGAIVFLVSLGIGLQKVVTEQVVGSKSVKSIDVSSSKPKTIRLNSEAIDKFKQLPNVIDVAKTYSLSGKVIFQSSSTDAVLNGVSTEYLSLGSFKLVSGKRGVLQSDDEILLNASLLKAIGISDGNNLIGKKLRIFIAKDKRPDASDDQKDFEKELTVVGVVESGSGAEIFTTEDVFKNAGFSDYNQAKVILRSKEDVSGARKQIEALGFITASPVDTLDQINQVFGILNLLLAGFGSIGMVIAVLGMFNTLTISLLERTKEIGLLVSLGARKKDVRRLFVIEALILSMMGAVIGLLVAWGLGGGINLILLKLAESKGVNDSFAIFYIPLWLIGSVIVFTFVVGLLVVTYPAARASRINPIDALRHE